MSKMTKSDEAICQVITPCLSPGRGGHAFPFSALEPERGLLRVRAQSASGEIRECPTAMYGSVHSDVKPTNSA